MITVCRVQPLAELKRLTVALLCIWMVGCASAPENTRPLNAHVPPEMTRDIEKEDTSNVGVVYATVFGTTDHPETLWINDIPVATQKRGYIRLPLWPGEYRLKNQAAGYDAHELTFSISAGETLYFDGGAFLWDPHAEVTRSEFWEWIDGAAWERNKQISFENARHKYLPPRFRQVVEQCLEEQSLESCQQARQTVPAVLLSPHNRNVIDELVETKLVQKEKDAEAARQELEASLPKPVLRDQYMVALRDALAAQNYEKALPIFQRLQNLEMPLDPDFYYFYGEALHETGEQQEALQATSRYLRTQGSQAGFYQEALQLLNRIQEAM